MAKKQFVERKIKVQCGMCGGDGQQGRWNKKDKNGFEIWEVRTCGDCHGSGEVLITVHDYRTERKRDEMVEPRCT